MPRVQLSRQAAVTRVVSATRVALRHHPDPGPVLDRLEERLLDLVVRWDLELGDAYGDGIGGPVLAVTAGGRPAVLKLEGATPAFAAQVAALAAAQGRGYAAVLASDVAAGAVLLERLGPTLASAGLPPDRQVGHLVGPVQRTWELPVAPGQEATAKADQLAGILRTLPERVLSPAERAHWAPALIEAGRLAAHLSTTRDPDREVLCHGDPHPGNALLGPETTDGDRSYRLVDPDGIVTEPEYDLGVVLRDFSRELLAAPGASAARDLHAGLCLQAAAATGTDPERAGQWAMVERVTTGLYLRWFHDDDTAAAFLDSALLLLRR